jgi:hypothetical protein
MNKLLAWLTVPVLLCCAVGVIRGRLRAWLSYGVAIDMALIGMALLSLIFRI